jgi:hypothetical protein
LAVRACRHDHRRQASAACHDCCRDELRFDPLHGVKQHAFAGPDANANHIQPWPQRALGARIRIKEQDLYYIFAYEIKY